MTTIIANLTNDSPEASWEEVLKLLEDLTKSCQVAENREQLVESQVQDVSDLFKNLSEEGSTSTPIRYCCLTESFRFLRNAAVGCTRNQDFFRKGNLFEIVNKLFKRMAPTTDTAQLAPDVDSNIVAFRCALQFLANSVVDNRENCSLVCSTFSDFLTTLLTDYYPDDEKIVQHAAMIIHLGLKQTPQDMIVTSVMLEALLNNLHLEFVIYAMESFVSFGRFTELYEELSPKDRIKILSFLKEKHDLINQLREEIMFILKSNFIERSDFILRSKIRDQDNLFCWEIAVLLELLCAASSLEVQSLKSDRVLMTTTLCLLRQVDATGKESGAVDNMFSPVEDLEKLTSTSAVDDQDDDIRAHPTFQFKANLIRLVANLAHRHKENQDKARELECLPIILNSCKIDARNPFIGQWSVLAIRNLCEGNAENQAYIKQVQRVDTENLIPKLHLVGVEKDT